MATVDRIGPCTHADRGFYCRKCGALTCVDCDCDCFVCTCPCHGDQQVYHDYREEDAEMEPVSYPTQPAAAAPIADVAPPGDDSADAAQAEAEKEEFWPVTEGPNPSHTVQQVLDWILDKVGRV